MSEEDFVFAWALACRAGSEVGSWTESRERTAITQAKRMYKLIKQECKDETDSRTED